MNVITTTLNYYYYITHHNALTLSCDEDFIINRSQHHKNYKDVYHSCLVIMGDVH